MFKDGRVVIELQILRMSGVFRQLRGRQHVQLEGDRLVQPQVAVAEHLQLHLVAAGSRRGHEPQLMHHLAALVADLLEEHGGLERVIYHRGLR